MAPPPIKSKPRRAANEVILSLVGSIVLASIVPWELVFSSTTPNGGDNPAHPSLVRSIGEAFFEHGQLVHYSYKFWGGFEAFQFYFPLPYWFAAAVARVAGLAIGYKLMSVIAVVLLPTAFYFMARFFQMNRLSAFVAALLSIPFLMTEAHVMWGGNIFSNLAGMTANAWGFVFFVLAFGKLCQARLERQFSISGVLFMVLAMLSHFYAMLMLLLLYALFGLEDLTQLVRRRRVSLAVYLMGALAVALMAWWVFPLIAYKPYSTNFGSDWNFTLLSTFTDNEKIVFPVCFILLLLTLAVKRGRDTLSWYVLGFASFAVIVYFSNFLFNSTAFNNVRLWPTVYFSCYLIAIVSFDRFVACLSGAGFVVRKLLPLGFLALLVLLVPSDNAFQKAREWMKWNNEGLELRPGGKDFAHLVKTLNALPPGRVSFEISDDANGVFGSVRTFEMLPALTHQEIIEGGIVNSATFPGISYTLQCLTSKTCAGWPAGSIMPERDVERALQMMRELGVTYHIAQSKEMQEEFEATGQVEVMYRGEFARLYQLKAASPLVEVFAEAPPVLHKELPHTLLLNLPRWDAVRGRGYVFDSALVAGPEGRRVDYISLINFLVDEWHAGRRMTDGNRKDRVEKSRHFLHTVLFSWRAVFSLERELKKGPDIFIGDTDFAPDTFVANLQQRYSEAAVPLTRDEPGQSEVLLIGRGYDAFFGGKQIAFNARETLEFKSETVAGRTGAFGFLTLKPSPGEQFRVINIYTDDNKLHARFPGAGEIAFAKRITEKCLASVNTSFHRIELRTNCSGKPHLIKYAYFPKWQAPVPIYLGPYGFMLITPEAEVTVLEHRWQKVDQVSVVLSVVALFVLAGLVLMRRGR